MEAGEGPGMSYSWRSIVRGIKALRNGIIWRVGDGEQIRIWEDPWLPRGVIRQLITPRGATLLSKVFFSRIRKRFVYHCIKKKSLNLQTTRIYRAPKEVDKTAVAEPS